MSEITTNPNNNYSDRLKQAVNSLEAPPFLESRIRNSIRLEEAKPAGSWKMRWAAIAVATAACVIAAVGYIRFTAENQETYIARVSNQVATLMRVGLGDHIHCSIYRKQPKTPPQVAKFVEDLGPKYAGLIPVVRQNVPSKYTMMQAHQCSYHKRKFVHLSLAGDGNLMSIVIAHKQDGESFQTEGLMPSLVQSGIPLYQAGAQKFAINAFESRDHLVFFVSDLSKQRNAEMMLALAPSMREFLKTLEL
jgi:hypothetical protein